MEILKYKIIKSKTQYNLYCKSLETLTEIKLKTKATKDEIELLTLLIEKYDAEHNTFEETDPIELIKSLMVNHRMKSIDLANLLGVSTGLVSDMLNYKKGLSKDTIRLLSIHFKINQGAFNQPYKLVSEYNSHLRNASVMNTQKSFAAAS